MGNDKYRPYVLIVDDEPHFSESLQMALEDSFTVTIESSIGSARKSLAEQVPDAILLDLRLPDGSGIDLLGELKAFSPMPVVIMMTAHAALENAIAALKKGAVDYFTKPLDIEKLKRDLNVYLDNRFLQEKVITLSREIKKNAPSFITSGTGRMKEIVDKVPMVASLNIPILIKGETGTGKEKLAEWIHALSGVSGDLVTINCSALPKDIFESEFFGHTRGAFSGAIAHKEGLIEQAEGGTLLLDEIGELPESVQAKFLRVLEEGVYYKVGETKERRVIFRLISATNKDLSDPLNNFRQDLFYRVNGITFEMPPLRERRDDIPLLVPVFIKEANKAYNKNVSGVSKKVMDMLMQYEWPGNIRELKWSVLRAVAISRRDLIDIDDMSASPALQPAIQKDTRKNNSMDIFDSLSFSEGMERVERKYIEDALAAAGENKTEAARILGISVRTLHYKMKQYNM